MVSVCHLLSLTLLLFGIWLLNLLLSIVLILLRKLNLLILWLGIIMNVYWWLNHYKRWILIIHYIWVLNIIILLLFWITSIIFFFLYWCLNFFFRRLFNIKRICFFLFVFKIFVLVIIIPKANYLFHFISFIEVQLL